MILGLQRVYHYLNEILCVSFMGVCVERILERKEQQKQINDESAMACNVMLFFKYVTVISYGPYSSLLSLFPLQEATRSIATHSEITLPLPPTPFPPSPPVLPFHLFPQGSLVTICTKEYSEAKLCNTNISSSLF